MFGRGGATRFCTNACSAWCIYAFRQSSPKNKIHAQHSQIVLENSITGLAMLEMDVHIVI